MSDLLKILEILKDTFKYIVDFCHKYESSKVASMIKMFILLPAVPVILYIFLLRNDHYLKVKSDNIIYEKIFELVRGCGKYHFVSWAVLDDSPYLKKKLIFKDVIGCIGDDKQSCGISIKNDNPIYNKEYLIRMDDYLCINSIKDGSVVRHNIKEGKIVSDGTVDEKCVPVVLEKIVASTNLGLKNIRYTLVRDFKRNIVYIFGFSSAINSIPTCTSQIANTLLLNIAQTAKTNF